MSKMANFSLEMQPALTHLVQALLLIIRKPSLGVCIALPRRGLHGTLKQEIYKGGVPQEMLLKDNQHLAITLISEQYMRVMVVLTRIR